MYTQYTTHILLSTLFVYKINKSSSKDPNNEQIKIIIICYSDPTCIEKNEGYSLDQIKMAE